MTTLTPYLLFDGNCPHQREEAQVIDPLKEVFVGVFGALNDKFGVRWMFQAARNG